MKTKFTLFLVLLTSFWLIGCAAYYRPYVSAETSGFDVAIPSSEEIIEFADGVNELRLDVEMEEAWDAALRAAFSGGNIIGVDRQSTTNRRILVALHTLELFDPPFLAKFSGRVNLVPSEVWFAIDLTTNGAVSTNITIAWINPKTMQPDNPHTTDVSDKSAVRHRATSERLRSDFLKECRYKVILSAGTSLRRPICRFKHLLQNVR